MRCDRNEVGINTVHAKTKSPEDVEKQEHWPRVRSQELTNPLVGDDDNGGDKISCVLVSGSEHYCSRVYDQ